MVYFITIFTLYLAETRVVVNCESGAVRMYAADPSIVSGSGNEGQGGNELKVCVLANTKLQWRAVPLQVTEGSESESYWQVIIDKVHLWSNANQYLYSWETSDGGPVARIIQTQIV